MHREDISIYPVGLPDPGPWVANAACQGTSAVLFYSMTPSDIRAAKTICSGCVVQDECLTYVIDNDIDSGVWGGTDEIQRRVARRNLKDHLRMVAGGL